MSTHSQYADRDFGAAAPVEAIKAANVKQCAYCDAHYPNEYGFTPPHIDLDPTDDIPETSVCTEACHWHNEARKLIRGVVYDHQYCGSCFRQLKKVYAPGRNEWSSDRLNDIPAWVIGEAFAEPHTERGEGTQYGLRKEDEETWTIDSTGLVATQWICSCGCTEHTDTWRPDGDLSKGEATALGNRLLEALEARRGRSIHDEEYHEQEFFDHLRYRKGQPDVQGEPDNEHVEKALGSALCRAEHGYGIEP